VILYGKRIFAITIKGLNIKRPSWIILMGLESMTSVLTKMRQREI
jgi:hypothetical protein